MIKLSEYGTVISDEITGQQILDAISKELENSETVTVDFYGVSTMATFCAKQIFGSLYLKLSPEIFNKRIELTNTNEDIKIIIRWGILHAIEDSEKPK